MGLVGCSTASAARAHCVGGNMEELEYFQRSYGELLGHLPLQEAALANAPGMIWIGASEREVVIVRDGQTYTLSVVDALRNADPELRCIPATEFPEHGLTLLSDYPTVPQYDRVVLSTSSGQMPLIDKYGKPSCTLYIGGLSDEGEPPYMRKYLYDSLAMAGILPNRVYAVERWIRPGKIVKFKDVKGYWYPHPSLFVPVA